MRSTLNAGDWVEVRSAEEILGTLDGKGQLDGMPWMPEMFQFCGRKFQVYKRAHKSCDYTTPYPFSSRWIEEAVLLDTRCDGSAHGGCQAGCQIFWKEAWLKPVDGTATIQIRRKSSGPTETVPSAADKTDQEFQLWSHAQITNPTDRSIRYSCQTTELPKASTPMAWWDLRQYIEDFRSGNVSLRRLAGGFIYAVYFSVSHAGIGVGPAMAWLYNKCCWIWGGSLFPRMPGLLPAGKPTPHESLNLQPGELVRVKSHEEILKTVTTENLNRGMYWDAELVPYCGGTYRVLRRVSRIIDEKNGKMLEMKTPCIILDSVVCQARYSSCRMFCPREMYPYWREIWLERVVETSAQPAVSPEALAVSV
jgi:hypothetical protein